MELLFHGGGSEGDVLRRDWGSKNPERVAANPGEGEAAELQLPRSDWHCRKAFLGDPLCHRLRTFTAHPTGLPTGGHRTAGSQVVSRGGEGFCGPCAASVEEAKRAIEARIWSAFLVQRSED